MRLFLIIAACCALPLGTAAAENLQRFELRQDGDGYVRLDTESGAMSVCRQEGEQLVCRMAADDRTALEDETERLRADIERLEARVSALEKTRVAVPLPSDQDIDRTLGLMERLFRGFVDITRDLERENREEKLPQNRT